MYRVKLTEFEGPLDLLLFFIKRDELEIEDIPIAKITMEFLEYLHVMAQTRTRRTKRTRARSSSGA